MKASFLLPVAVVGILATTAPAQTINWGSEVFSALKTSTGATIPETGYVFQLGAFVYNDPQNGLVNWIPTESNMNDWLSYWRLFDDADYNAADGYFTSTVEMTDLGRSPTAGSADINFSGLNAYIWIRNSDIPNQPSTEWLLVRDLSWTFPTPSTGCCDPTLPLEWSISDLNNIDVPVYGYQSVDYVTGEAGTLSRPGAGVVTDFGGYTLQTASFTPEPTSAALIVMLGVLGLTRRQREGKG